MKPGALLLLSGFLLLYACAEQRTLSARRVARADELVGGPSAYGQVGDFLLENDRVRFVIGSADNAWAFGLYGGSLLDADLRRWEPQFRGGNGLDRFAETFPTINLVVPNPQTPEVTVLKDGSDGKEAVVRVQARGAFLFDALSILGSDLVKTIIQGVRSSFDFTTDYVLKPGDPYVTIRTTVSIPDPGPSVCGALACDKKCPDGFKIDDQGCPLCECGSVTALTRYTDPTPVFLRILGDLPIDLPQKYKAGIVAGDFLFFGQNTNIFAPGIAFDEDKEVFLNLYEGNDTITAPLAFDYVAAVGNGDEVSYAFFSARRPEEKVADAKCSWEVVITAFDPATKDQLKNALLGIGLNNSAAQIGLDSLAGLGVPLVVETGLSEKTAVPRVDDLTKQIGVAGVNLEPRKGAECRDPKLLVPLFTTASTAVMSAGNNCLFDSSDDATCDGMRTFTFERYLSVGSGDVGSALAPFYRLRGVETGTLSGVVLEGGNMRPLSRARVFVAMDPDPAKDFKTFDEFATAATAKSRNLGIITQFTTDVGVDHNRNGEFSGLVPAGSYIVFARHADSGASRIARVTVSAGRASRVNLLLDTPARVKIRALDEGGARIPARAQFISLGADGKPLPRDGRRLPSLGDSRFEDGMRLRVNMPGGEGTTSIEPGRYRVVVSHGLEYSIHVVPDITLEPGEVRQIDAIVRREVDTTGWIGADFHLHTAASVDSGLSIEDRVIAAVVDGVEFITSTDHDSITDYEPVIEALHLEDKVSSQIGVELTTLELGHYQAFPVRYDEQDLPTHGAPNWVCKEVPEIFQILRDAASDGPDGTVVQVNHPRDGFNGIFDQAGVNSYTLDRKAGMMEENNVLLRRMSCDFDAIELLNEKRHELIRTPTVGEINDFNKCFPEINAAATNEAVRDACAWMDKCAGDGKKTRACGWYGRLRDEMKRCSDAGVTLRECKDGARTALTAFIVRRLIERTADEQKAMVDAVAAGAGSELCAPGSAVDPAALPAADAVKPCAKHEGVIDDWFNLLNHGLRPTGTGNSDSHDLFYEAGYPRNYVKSPTDAAWQIDRRSVNANVKAGHVVISAGPFIQFTVNGHDVGDEVAAAQEQALVLHVRVQTPSWFGVDRVEIYRNGELWRGIDIEVPPEQVIDFDQDFMLARGTPDWPAEDSWFVVVALGTEDGNFLAPVYSTIPLGKLQLPKLTNIAFSKIPLVGDFLKPDPGIPDFFPILPYGVTNPIWVDVDGGGFKPRFPDLPLFCPRSCTPVKDKDGKPVLEKAECPAGQVCYPEGWSGDAGKDKWTAKGVCGVQIDGKCIAAKPVTGTQTSAIEGLPLVPGRTPGSRPGPLGSMDSADFRLDPLDRGSAARWLALKVMRGLHGPRGCGL